MPIVGGLSSNGLEAHGIYSDSGYRESEGWLACGLARGWVSQKLAKSGVRAAAGRSSPSVRRRITVYTLHAHISCPRRRHSRLQIVDRYMLDAEE